MVEAAFYLGGVDVFVAEKEGAQGLGGELFDGGVDGREELLVDGLDLAAFAEVACA